jgi:hypothetical protein
MPGDDIVFQFDIAAEPGVVRSAVATAEGVAGWWTDRAEVEGGPGGRAVLEFPDAEAPYDVFRHGGFRDDESRAIPAFIWGQIMPLLRRYAETGERRPFFSVSAAA